MFDLEQAWNWREIWKKNNASSPSPAYRVFHGPGESKTALRFFAIDRFGDHYWVTEWQNSEDSRNLRKGQGFPDGLRERIVQFYRQKGAQSIVGLSRPVRGLPPQVEAWTGTPPSQLDVIENGLRFRIQFEKTRHPGLFLDHEPLRSWLLKNSAGSRVLNTFAYTGSLSVAAAIGNAKQVVTLDLSKTTLQWAQTNLELNGIREPQSRIIAGDVFEWLPRLKREKEKFDRILLDPPSFSHGKKGRFSTSQDLKALHSLALDLLHPGGLLITSINSANISWKKFETEVLGSLSSRKGRFAILKHLDLPETFPTLLGESEDRYLKGWILKFIEE